MNERKVSRRDFMRSASTALAVPYILTSGALQQGNRPGANERVNIGIIGLGGRARAMAQTCALIPEVQVVAVCDCFAPAIGSFVKDLGAGQNWATYIDFREMCEKEKLEGVMVETTTHARAWVTVLAMERGMDVYIEKPMSLTIAEGREMVRAARHYKRVTQVGTQQRSMPINNWASDLVKSGALGKVKTVLAPNFVGPEIWTDQPGQPLPEGGSDQWWDIWTNQAVFRPYHQELHRGWMRWWDYDGGGLSFGVTGWGTHAYDQINRALGTDETGPIEVILDEPVERKGVFPDPNNSGLVGPRAKVTMRFANGVVLQLHRDRKDNSLHGLGATFVCEKGTIEIERNQLWSDPPEIIQSPNNPGPNQLDESQYHVQNWVDCIKSRKRCTADIEYGQRSHTLCHLVNIARELGRVGESLRWRPEAERFADCEEGNALLSRPRRKGYELPELS
ncbi:MAG: Gfo/Idh/MocA family protein [Candidatus Zipacnadales bacterium]